MRAKAVSLTAVGGPSPPLASTRGWGSRNCTDHLLRLRIRYDSSAAPMIGYPKSLPLSAGTSRLPPPAPPGCWADVCGSHPEDHRSPATRSCAAARPQVGLPAGQQGWICRIDLFREVVRGDQVA